MEPVNKNLSCRTCATTEATKLHGHVCFVRFRRDRGGNSSGRKATSLAWDPGRNIHEMWHNSDWLDSGQTAATLREPNDSFSTSWPTLFPSSVAGWTDFTHSEIATTTTTTTTSPPPLPTEIKIMLYGPRRGCLLMIPWYPESGSFIFVQSPTLLLLSFFLFQSFYNKIIVYIFTRRQFLTRLKHYGYNTIQHCSRSNFSTPQLSDVIFRYYFWLIFRFPRLLVILCKRNSASLAVGFYVLAIWNFKRVLSCRRF